MKLIVAFGCPRSGTTFLLRALETLGALNVHVLRASEFWKCHPCRSDLGLVGLAQLFHEHQIVFVRIKRHPLDVARSFMAVRKGLVRMGGGLGLNTPERVSQWIHQESEGFWKQVELVQSWPKDAKTKFPFRVLEIKYEHLGIGSVLHQYSLWLNSNLHINPYPFEDFVASNWKKPKKAAIAGRLRSGVSNEVLTPDELQFFRRELKDVCEREGYDPND